MASVGGGESHNKTEANWGLLRASEGPTSANDYLALFEKFLPAMQAIGEPSRVRATDTAQLQGQGLMQSFNEDAGRRGLSGSGFHLQGRNAIRGGTAANINDEILTFYRDALQRAAAQARETQALQVARFTQTPFQSKGSAWDANVAVGM